MTDASAIRGRVALVEDDADLRASTQQLLTLAMTQTARERDEASQ